LRSTGVLASLDMIGLVGELGATAGI